MLIQLTATTNISINNQELQKFDAPFFQHKGKTKTFTIYASRHIDNFLRMPETKNPKQNLNVMTSFLSVHKYLSAGLSDF